MSIELTEELTDDDWNGPDEIPLPSTHLWFVCQSCGFREVKKRPKEYKAYKCSHCKSEDSMPQGY